MNKKQDRTLAYALATPVNESQWDSVSGGSGAAVGGKIPHVVITGRPQIPDLVIER